MTTPEIEKKEQFILELLEEVIDPELDINIIDLGLVYEIHYQPEQIDILMTLTSEDCPMGDTILQGMETILKRNFPEQEINIKITFDPPWDTDMITEKGKEML